MNLINEFFSRSVTNQIVGVSKCKSTQKTYIQNPSQQYQNHHHHHQINKYHHLHQQQLINVRYPLQGRSPPQKSIFAKERPNPVKLGEYVDATMESV